MLATVTLATMALAGLQTDLLPDIIIWDEELHNWEIGTTTSSEPPAGRLAIRFNTATANIGLGNLELIGQSPSGGGQPVNQRIYRSNGTSWQRLAGTMTYHAGHSHIHFDDWTVFRLRRVLQGGGVGGVVRTGQKTSFCILELRTYNSSLPGYNGTPAYNSCGNVQGLRPGRADVYSSGLTDQYIDITGLPEDDYWLEGEVDPDNLVLEVDETNNAARIMVRIGTPPPPQPDPYEDNDTKAITDARTEGAAFSPNLGLINSVKVINGLSIEDSADWYRFRLNQAGTSSDFVKVASSQTIGGDLDLQLCNSSGTVIASSTSTQNTETISLNGRPAGTYYARAFPKSGTITNYTLTIDPAANRPPTFNFVTPAAPGVWTERAYETVHVTWYGGDPDGDPKYVSFWIDRSPTTGPTNIPLNGYQGIPGNDYFANLNTAEMSLGRWYLQARATDGGAETIKWAPGWFTLYVKGDVNFDGYRDLLDWRLAEDYRSKPVNTYPEGWATILDIDRDGDCDQYDWKAFATSVGKE